MGGRAASLLADELNRKRWGARLPSVLGYPFHAARQDRCKLRKTENTLSACRRPTLILQGERDHVGRRRGGGEP